MFIIQATIITRALRHQLIIPDFPEFTSMLDIMFEDAKEVDEGEVASYIPQLAK